MSLFRMEIAMDVARVFKPCVIFCKWEKKNHDHEQYDQFHMVSPSHVFKFNAHMITFFKTSMDILMKLAQKDYYFMITQDS